MNNTNWIEAYPTPTSHFADRPAGTCPPAGDSHHAHLALAPPYPSLAPASGLEEPHRPETPGPAAPFGTCPVPSCAQSARVLDADTRGGRILCVRCGRTEALLAHAARQAMDWPLSAIAAVGLLIICAGAIAWAAGLLQAGWLPVISGLIVTLFATAGFAARLIAVAQRLRGRLRWSSSWELHEGCVPGWGVRQAALLGLLRDLRIGNTRSLEDVVWKAQRDAEDAVRKAWIAPHDPEAARHLARVRAFGPHMDRTLRSFIARLQHNPPVEAEAHALVAALLEAMDA